MNVNEEIRKSVPNPCNGFCAERDGECHGKCERYAAYRAWIDECNQRRHAEKDVYGISDRKLSLLRKNQRRRNGRNSGRI